MSDEVQFWLPSHDIAGAPFINQQFFASAVGQGGSLLKSTEQVRMDGLHGYVQSTEFRCRQCLMSESRTFNNNVIVLIH